jgi:hypothetical protein
MDGHGERVSAHPQTLPPANVRVLQSEEELAEAIARAAVSAKRLHDRLAARAAHDEWMAEHTGQRVEWLRFVRGSAGDEPLLGADGPGNGATIARRTASSPPAA